MELQKLGLPAQDLFVGVDVLMFKNGAAADDIAQGFIGNCWIIAAISAAASLIEKEVFRSNVQYIQGQSVTVCLYDPVKKKFEALEVKDCFPIHPCGMPKFAEPQTPGEAWVLFLEKAFAQLFGNYAKLEANFPEIAFQCLTGCSYIDILEKTAPDQLGSPDGDPVFIARRPHPEQSELGSMRYQEVCMEKSSSSRQSGPAGQQPGGGGPQGEGAADLKPLLLLGREAVWKILEGAKRDNELVVCCTDLPDVTGCTQCMEGGTCADCHQASQDQARRYQGLQLGHAYTLLQVLTLGEDKIRLVRLRNPHGKGEWQGAFSDADIKDRWPDVKKLIEHTGVYHRNKDDGAFHMSLEDFISRFCYIVICNINKKAYRVGEVPEGYKLVLQDSLSCGGYSKGASKGSGGCSSRRGGNGNGRSSSNHNRSLGSLGGVPAPGNGSGGSNGGGYSNAPPACTTAPTSSSSSSAQQDQARGGTSDRMKKHVKIVGQKARTASQYVLGKASGAVSVVLWSRGKTSAPAVAALAPATGPAAAAPVRPSMSDVKKGMKQGGGKQGAPVCVEQQQQQPQSVSLTPWAGVVEERMSQQHQEGRHHEGQQQQVAGYPCVTHVLPSIWGVFDKGVQQGTPQQQQQQESIARPSTPELHKEQHSAGVGEQKPAPQQQHYCIPQQQPRQQLQEQSRGKEQQQARGQAGARGAGCMQRDPAAVETCSRCCRPSHGQASGAGRGLPGPEGFKDPPCCHPDYKNVDPEQLEVADHIRRGVVHRDVRQTLRQAASDMGFPLSSSGGPHILEPLLCDLNHIKDPEADLRLSSKDFLLLPPEHIVRSGRRYLVLLKGQRLADVLERRIEDFKVSYGAVTGMNTASPCRQILRDNPWIQADGLGWCGEHNSDIVRYIALPDDVVLRGREGKG